MKTNLFPLLILLVSLFLTENSFAQTKGENTDKEISTIGILDTNRTKSGYRINEYYVELSDSLFDALKGKKISVTGKLLIVKAINPNAKEMEQGALHDRSFIIEPKFTIIYDSREPLKTD